MCSFGAYYLVLLIVATLSDGYSYHSFQRSIQCNTPHFPVYPSSLSEIQEAVHYALSHNVKVKAVGSLHSASDCICTTGIPIFMSNITHFSFEPISEIVTVGAGMEIQDLYENLHSLNRAIRTGPEFGGITVGGAIANGGHGSSLKHFTSLSEQLVSITFVDGRGKVRKLYWYQEKFKALKLNVGLLGIIYEVELATVPQYKLLLRHSVVSDKILRNSTEVLRIARDHDLFHFWWYPANRQVVLGIGNQFSVSHSGNCRTTFMSNITRTMRDAVSLAMDIVQSNSEYYQMFFVNTLFKQSLYQDVMVTTPLFVEEDGQTPCFSTTVGYAHRLTSSRCTDCPWDDAEFPLGFDEMEILVPLSQFPAAIATLQDISEKYLIMSLLGIYVRFVGKSNAYMAPYEGNEGMAIFNMVEIRRMDMTQPKLGMTTWQLITQILIDKHDGRVNWAKNGPYYSNAEILRRDHPKLDLFINAMKMYDPQEVFMNDFGTRVKYGVDVYTLRPEMTRHCAVTDSCICSSNLDCGDNGPLAHSCGHLRDYPKYNVCLPGIIDRELERFSKFMIDSMSLLDFSERAVLDYLSRQTDFKSVFGDSFTIK